MYEVYIATHKDGRCLYVGQGHLNRHRHCNSGGSHVVGLNKIYHTEGSDVIICGVVSFFKTKEEAEAYEKVLIEKHRPILNKVYTDKNTRTPLAHEGAKIAKTLRNYLKEDKRVRPIPKYTELVEEFLSVHGTEGIRERTLKILTSDDYMKLGKPRLQAFATYLRSKEGKRNFTYSSYFIECFKEKFNIDLKSCLAYRVSIVV